MRAPNLLFLFTDEQRADTMAAYGNHAIETPNLNRLARQSVVFDRAYCTQPVCTASRSSILTGLYPHATGCTENNIPLRTRTPCLPELLARGRYATGYFGKWHLGDEVFAQHGFHEWRSIEDGYRRYYSPGRDPGARSSYNAFLRGHGFRPGRDNEFARSFAASLPERFSKPAYLAREACAFLRAHRRDPFVLFVNFLEPHMPFFGPRDHQHPPRNVTLPRNFRRPPRPDQHLKSRLIHRVYRENGFGGMPLRTEADWRRLIANYWGLVSLVDTHVGEILRTVTECGLDDNTIVIFTSDHGDMMGSHQLLAKCVMFEEAMRVPLLVRLPGQRRSLRVRHAVSLVDLVPTLLDLMEQPVPVLLQGSSRRAELHGERRPPADVVVEWNGRETGSLESFTRAELPDYLAGIASREEFKRAQRDTIRTIISPEGWKLNWSMMGQHELYHLRRDPGETTNLIARPDARAVIDDLAVRLRRWQEHTHDGAPAVTVS